MIRPVQEDICNPGSHVLLVGMQEYAAALLLLAFAPGIFWLWYFYHRDRYGPEPLLWIFRVFLLGMLMTVPAALAENALSFFLTAFAISVIAAPLIEEALKYIVVRKTVYETTDFSEPVDGIVYATAAALGFATLENLGYVILSYQSSVSFAFQTGLLRAFLSVPAHALFSCMWGYALGRAKYRPEPERGIIILKGFILAVFFHSMFNLTLYYNYIGMGVLILLIIPLMWWIVDRDIKRALLQHYSRESPGQTGDAGLLLKNSPGLPGISEEKHEDGSQQDEERQ